MSATCVLTLCCLSLLILLRHSERSGFIADVNGNVN